ncbi:MAG: hypothetical protein HYS12_07060 [Planctomycetes bacterium]|nr:hypothetical protein [Planctomycetota bacterium]
MSRIAREWRRSASTPAPDRRDLGLGLAQAALGLFKSKFLVGGTASASLVVRPAPLCQGRFRPADLLLPAHHLPFPVVELSVQPVERPLDLGRGAAEGSLRRHGKLCQGGSQRFQRLDRLDTG